LQQSSKEKVSQTANNVAVEVNVSQITREVKLPPVSVLIPFSKFRPPAPKDISSTVSKTNILKNTWRKP
jgi:hypothetical protein